ncbi:hypothetical protein GS462_23770 [Rhodococcus hoagii]|uniref:hypothetical protein n=1 Tax=Rhodococcus hoagii TaxID=43767 RepID=UPI000A0FF159|nr:hypothetical protein [Prescottella equi]MBM4522898.1 hypothetical protein [Prescottella equi]MBM4653415.1 hypothetical protein [Prescottella equi]MBM4687215.1 hypothetical protein [Prescottella equi]ORL38674.1 hypothetical protein A6F59_25350 [Prescottella equi]BCN79027.1 hypothetical protein RE0346_26870 [Prescottella equi]
MRNDSQWTWTIGSAAAPVGLLGVALIGMLILNGTGHAIADIIANWLFVLMISALLFIPAIALTVYGAEHLERHPRAGRIIATIGLVGMSLLYIFIVILGFQDAVPISPSLSDPRWAPRLTIGETAAFAAPFITLTMGNAYTLSLLWSEQRVLDAPFPPMANGDEK